MIFYPLFNKHRSLKESVAFPKKKIFNDYDYIFSILLIIIIGFSIVGGEPFNGVTVSLTIYFAIRLLYKYTRK